MPKRSMSVDCTNSTTWVAFTKSFPLKTKIRAYQVVYFGIVFHARPRATMQSLKRMAICQLLVRQAMDYFRT